MATLGYFDEPTHDISDLFFNIPGGSYGFKVTGFNEGYAEVTPFPYSEIEGVLDSILGCFETCSNFRQELYKVYNCPENAVFKGIKLTHEGVTLIVTPNTIDKYKLLAEYWKERYNRRVHLESFIATGNPYSIKK